MISINPPKDKEKKSDYIITMALFKNMRGKSFQPKCLFLFFNQKHLKTERLRTKALIRSALSRGIGRSEAESYFFFFFERKISHELTSNATLPLSAEEDWPWANIRAQLSLFYMGRGHTMSWQVVHQCTPRIGTCEPWDPKTESLHLTTTPLGQPLFFFPYISFKWWDYGWLHFLMLCFSACFELKSKNDNQVWMWWIRRCYLVYF